MPATQERSAGFIVYHEAPADGPPSDRRRFLLLDYGRFWDFAKGHVEPGETDLQAAHRELQEEAGIVDVTVVPGFAREITYFFRHGKRGLIRKTVVFFLARSAGDEVAISHEHKGYAWLPYEQAVQQVTYASARQVLKDAQVFLTNE